MTQIIFPTIDLKATGENIIRLRKENGYSVRELQRYFGFEEPQAIYKWQQGKCLPSVDNLYALSRLFGVSMNEILVQASQLRLTNNGQSSDCPFPHFTARFGSSRVSKASDQFCGAPKKLRRRPLEIYKIIKNKIQRIVAKRLSVLQMTKYRLFEYRTCEYRVWRNDLHRNISRLSRSYDRHDHEKKHAALQFICT